MLSQKPGLTWKTYKEPKSSGLRTVSSIMMVEGRDALLTALLYTARTGVLNFVLEHLSESQTDCIKFQELSKVDEY
jgi:hypothetical protein